MNPAAHSARADAERRGTIVGSDVDRIESTLIPATAEDEVGGAWLAGERPPSSPLWGVMDE